MRHQALSLLLLLALRSVPAAESEQPFAFGPVRFEENRGQSAPGVSFLARARGHHVLIQGNGILLSPADGQVVRFSFDGASEPRWTPQGAPASSISYFVGNDPSKWVKDAPIYDRIAWNNLYPGIDLILYGSGDRLEYDLVLAPNADPSRVRLRFSASAKPTLHPDGAIEVGGILQRPPHIHQHSRAGVRTTVAGRFKAAGNGLFTLELGTYDPSLPLTVDPVLEASSYFGGENDDEIISIGDGYVAGNTRSVGLPNAVPVVRGSRDVFIRGTGQVVPGSGLSAYTFSGTLVIGGSDDDELGAIAIQYAGGDAFVVAGTTRSKDFPSATNNYHGGSSDGFLFFVSERYQLIRDVTYLGGSGEDRIHAAAVDSTLFAVVGVTDSSDLPLNGGFQRTFGGGKDAFYILGRLANPAFWNSGILGGSGDDSAWAAALRSSSLWIAGDTTSPDFPSTRNTLSGPSDAFLTRLTYKYVNSIPDVDVVEQESHLIGGSGNDSIRSLAAVPSSLGAPSPTPSLPAMVGFAGITSSADLPVKNAAQPAFGGETDGFAGAWDSKSASVSWLTYIGGTSVDEAASIDQNWAGDFYVAGWTRSGDLFLANPLQAVNAGGEDALFAVYGVDGAPIHVSYFGGSGDDRARAVRLLYNSVARIAGSSTSTDLPVNDAAVRPPAMNGFIADVGTDHLIGGAEIVLPKDGTIKVSLRPGRTSYRPAVTWRSSDPSLVRFNYLGRPVDVVTTGDEAVTIEALGNGSEVTLTATAEGYLPKSIRVKLYPGVFVPTRSTFPNSTWNSPLSLNAHYYAYDPETGATVANSVALRPGAASPVFKWVSSNPGVVALEQSASGTKALFLAPGEAELTLAVEGYTVLDSRKISVLKPQIVPDGPVRVGKDLWVSVPCYPKIGGSYNTFEQMRGTLTARSSDPSRLLLSTASNQPGRETVTIPFSHTMSLLAHGLTSEGQADVILSSSELESDARVSVILEPAVIRFGRAGYDTGQAVVVPSFSLVAGNEPAYANLWLGIASSPGRLYRRPGAPPFTVQFSNSDPSVVQQNYASITPDREGLRLKGLKPGTADLTLSASDQEIRIVNPSVPVKVVPAPAIWQLPERIFLGQNLQTIVSFENRVVDGAAISIESSDPSAVLVSFSESEPGSRQITIAPRNPQSNNYSFWLQGLKSRGEARIRVVIAGVEERTIAVTLLPSGTGFTNLPTSNYGSVGVWAYDPVSGYGIAAQSPNPGVEVPARLRLEGPTLGVSQEPFVLTARAPSRQFTFSAPARGSETTLFVESQDPYSPVPGNSKATLRGAGLSVGTSGSTTLLMTQDMLAKLQFQAHTASEITLSSSDPQRLLVSASATEPGTASIRFNGGSVPGIYAHSLSDSGNATLRFESPGLPPNVVDVAFQPIRIAAANVTVAPSAETTVSAGVSYPLRPGAQPIRIGLRTADPAIATVKPDSIQIPSASTGNITIAGVSEGVTQLLYDAPPGVFVTPQFGTIGVARIDPPVYLLGKNLQGALQLPLAGFTNPGGAILTISSSDPAKVLLSRSDLAPGSPSASVTVPAGQSFTQPFYVQALESSGDVKLTATIDGRVTTLAIVRLGPTWVDCTSYGNAQLDVKLNLSRSAACYLRFDTSPYPSPSLQSVHLRVGAGDAVMRVSSSDPGIFTVQPDSLVFSPERSSGSVTLKGVALGSADLQVIQPEGLGQGPAGVEALPVVVSAPAISARTAEMIISRDSLAPLPLTVEGSPAITVTSEKPELLLVSKSPTALGVPSVTLDPSEPLYLHALGSQGTADVLLAAPGYESLRVGVALTRPTVGFTSVLSELGVGSSAMLELGLRGAYDARIRPGATFAIDLAVSPEGIVAIEPARVTIAPGQNTASFQIRALVPGTALVRISAPPDVVIVGAPLTLRVRP